MCLLCLHSLSHLQVLSGRPCGAVAQCSALPGGCQCQASEHWVPSTHRLWAVSLATSLVVSRQSWEGCSLSSIPSRVNLLDDYLTLFCVLIEFWVPLTLNVVERYLDNLSVTMSTVTHCSATTARVRSSCSDSCPSTSLLTTKTHPTTCSCSPMLRLTTSLFSSGPSLPPPPPCQRYSVYCRSVSSLCLRTAIFFWVV